MSSLKRLPQSGMDKARVFSTMEELRTEDADWKHAKTWSLVYFAGEDILGVAKEAYTRFFSENGLNPMAFPSLRRFERDVVQMSLSMMNAPDAAAGSMTSGGSESLLMAVKTAREWARKTRPHVKEPEMLIPLSAHPALEKAAHYFDVKAVHIPLDAEFRADAEAAKNLVNENTILIVGSAPAYPQGVIDPISALAALASSRGILCHVDACLGGFLLPFFAGIGREIPLFDFRVPGVTSISADIHKYGYAAKGASVVMYATRELRRYQYFSYADWPGGLYASPSMTGTRPGGAIAAAWAVMNYLGQSGYERLARETMQTADALRKGINQIPGLRILGNPDASVFAFDSDRVDVYQLADLMEKKGYKLDRQQRPPCLHMMVTAAHSVIKDAFLADLGQAVSQLWETKPAPEGSAAMYGMLGAAPDREAVGSMLIDFMDGLDNMP
jgi:glutamate/tyrosine decarboxylase-like PLP-dependent enzyme